ncbi:unnamed protein product [Caretta caretta]
MFTFVRVEAHGLRHSWLDRIYLSRFHLSLAHSSSIRPAPFSDHHLATVTVFLCTERPGPAYWHFNNSLLEDVGFMASFWEFWLAWRAMLALLPKKGDLCDLRNWRPVSLLSTDYKVIAKAISLWLGSVLADVIHPDQTYAIPGRTIFDNLYLVRDLLELRCRDGLSFALLSVDQEKAFDWVDHGRLTGLALREPELQLVLSAYASNVLLVVQDLGDLARVEACQAVYSAASSAWVNWVKSSGLVENRKYIFKYDIDVA